jgi:uncharacterized protein YggE
MFTKLAVAVGTAVAVCTALTACSSGSPAKEASFTARGTDSAAAGGAPAGAGATLTAAGATAPASAPRLITATGRGQASGVPDVLTATLGVQTNGADARTVLTTNSREAAALISRLQADGVAAADIKTVELSLNPVYTNPGPGESPRVSGFAANDTVSVTIRRLDRAGGILDDAAATGGSDTVIQSLRYSVADEGTLLAAAHADAVRQAQSTAKAMAGAASVALGPLQSVTDATPPEAITYAPEAAAAVPAASVPVPVQAGTEQVTADVTVSYAIG